MKKKKTAKKKVATSAKRVGATGRPPISEHGVKEKINISIDPDLKKYLDKLETRSSFINGALRAAIDNDKAGKRGKKAGDKVKRKSSSRSSEAA